MSYYDRPGPPRPTESPTSPTQCPACRSSSVTTTSKVVTTATYWRCEACGEVWNVTRREANRYSGSFRR